MKARFEFKLEDFWVGVFWKKTTYINGSRARPYKRLELWVCIIPCFPLHVTWERPGSYA